MRVIFQDAIKDKPLIPEDFSKTTTELLARLPGLTEALVETTHSRSAKTPPVTKVILAFEFPLMLVLMRNAPLWWNVFELCPSCQTPNPKGQSNCAKPCHYDFAAHGIFSTSDLMESHYDQDAKHSSWRERDQEARQELKEAFAKRLGVYTSLPPLEARYWAAESMHALEACIDFWHPKQTVGFAQPPAVKI